MSDALQPVQAKKTARPFDGVNEAEYLRDRARIGWVALKQHQVRFDPFDMLGRLSLEIA